MILKWGKSAMCSLKINDSHEQITTQIAKSNQSNLQVNV